MRLALRLYSYVFHLALAVFLFALGCLTALSGVNNLNLGMLPWEGARLTYGVLGLGLAGLVFTGLAILGHLKILFPLWAGVVFVLMFRGFFLSPFTFQGPHEFYGAILLTFGAFGAFLSAWTVLQSPKRVF